MDTALLETAIKLPFADRVALAEALWENIEEQGYEPALTLLQAAELDRRLEEYRKHPESGIPCEQVETELERKYDKRA